MRLCVRTLLHICRRCLCSWLKGIYQKKLPKYSNQAAWVALYRKFVAHRERGPSQDLDLKRLFSWASRSSRCTLCFQGKSVKETDRLFIPDILLLLCPQCIRGSSPKVQLSQSDHLLSCFLSLSFFILSFFIILLTFRQQRVRNFYPIQTEDLLMWHWSHGFHNFPLSHLCMYSQCEREFELMSKWHITNVKYLSSLCHSCPAVMRKTERRGICLDTQQRFIHMQIWWWANVIKSI